MKEKSLISRNTYDPPFCFTRVARVWLKTLQVLKIALPMMHASSVYEPDIFAHLGSFSLGVTLPFSKMFGQQVCGSS